MVDCPDLREKPWTLAAPGMVYYNWQANLFKYLSQQEGTKEKCNTHLTWWGEVCLLTSKNIQLLKINPVDEPVTLPVHCQTGRTDNSGENNRHFLSRCASNVHSLEFLKLIILIIN